MTGAEWAQFVCLGIAGALGLFCLFDGTRRVAARQAGGSPGRTAWVGVAIVGMLVAYSYWQYSTYSEAARSYQPHEPERELSADWGKKMTPAKREATSQGIARRAFIGSGILTPYVDASGQRRTYAPAQGDLKRREELLSAVARIEQKALSSFNDLILWLVLGLSAFVFGLGFASGSSPQPGDAEEAADAPPATPAG